MISSNIPEDCLWLLAKGMSQVTDTLIKNWTECLLAWILHSTPDGNYLLPHYWTKLNSNYCSMARKQSMLSLLLLSQGFYALALNNFQVILRVSSQNTGVMKEGEIRLMYTTFAWRIFSNLGFYLDFLKGSIFYLEYSFKIFRL